MEYLIDDKSRYAASILVAGFHNNVETALNEAERWARGEFGTLVSNWDQYYLIYNESWKTAYYIKKIPYMRYLHRKNPDVSQDDNVAKYRW